MPKLSFKRHQVELDVVQLFMHAAARVGIQRSLGELVGVLYSSEVPLSFKEVAGLLGISKGSASQSLRFLQEIHAVEVSYPGHRRPTYYKVEISLRRLVAGLVQSRIDPRLGGD